MPEGSRVGRYRLVRRIGAGAMGEVFLAQDPQIERRLAIKTVRLAAGFAGGEKAESETRARLLREAKAAGKLLHPNVVTLFDVGEANGELFLAFEYVEGSDLAKRMARSPALTLRDSLRIVREVAQGLCYAHQRGVIHRDIKPGNILLNEDGQAKVADFGIARLAGQATELTTTGAVIGSPQYLAPEQVRGEELDGRNDLFSLGVVFYQLLTGHRPFPGDTVTTLVYQILHERPRSVREFRQDLPSAVEGIVTRLLEKERDARFASAEELVAALKDVEASLADEILDAEGKPSSPRDGQTRRLAPGSQDSTRPLEETPGRPSGGRVWLAAGLLLASASAAGLWWQSSAREAAQPTPAGIGIQPAPRVPSLAPAGEAEGALPEVSAPVAEETGLEASGGEGSLPTDPRRESQAPESPGPLASGGAPPASGGGPGPAISGEEATVAGRSHARILQTGLEVKFDVEPADAWVSVNHRRMGRIEKFSKGGKVFRLPGPGEYHLVFRRQGFHESEVLIRADAERAGVVPVIVRLKQLPEGTASPGGPMERYEVQEAIAFRVNPPRARLMIDGSVRGGVAQFSERSGNWLTLEPGVYRVRVVAIGHRPMEVEVHVSPEAAMERQVLTMQLSRKIRP